MGAANKSMLGMSFVGERTAAAIRITINAVFQIFIRNLAVTNPIRAST
jgi:hypothetical protein